MTTFALPFSRALLPLMKNTLSAGVGVSGAALQAVRPQLFVLKGWLTLQVLVWQNENQPLLPPQVPVQNQSSARAGIKVKIKLKTENALISRVCKRMVYEPPLSFSRAGVWH
jgi:hypothetical protein